MNQLLKVPEPNEHMQFEKTKGTLNDKDESHINNHDYEVKSHEKSAQIDQL